MNNHLYCRVLTVNDGNFIYVVKDYFKHTLGGFDELLGQDLNGTLTEKDLFLMDWASAAFRAVDLQAEVHEAEFETLRIHDGFLNPVVVFLNDLILSMDQVKRLFEWLNDKLRHRGLKIGIRVEDAFMETIPISRYFNKNKISLYYFIKLIPLHEPIPDHSWNGRFDEVIDKMKESDEKIKKLEQANKIDGYNNLKELVLALKGESDQEWLNEGVQWIIQIASVFVQSVIGFFTVKICKKKLLDKDMLITFLKSVNLLDKSFSVPEDKP